MLQEKKKLIQRRLVLLPPMNGSCMIVKLQRHASCFQTCNFISRFSTLLVKKIVAITYRVICYYQIMVTESMTDIKTPENLDVRHTNHSLRSVRWYTILFYWRKLYHLYLLLLFLSDIFYLFCAYYNGYLHICIFRSILYPMVSL